MAATHPMLDAPGLAAHNDRYLSLAKGKFNWQVTACLALLLAMVLAVALAYQYGQRKEYAYVVEIDELGVARYVRELPVQEFHTPYVIQAQIAQFIKEIRTVTTDRVAFTQQLNASYATCLTDGQQYLSKGNTSRPIPFLHGQHHVGPIPTLKEDTHGSSTSHY